MTADEQVQGNWQELATHAVKVRDESMKAVDQWFPPPKDSNHWGELPDPLPKNVTGIPKTLLSPEDHQIMETDPLVLVKQITDKKYTAVRVAGAYLRAAIVAQRLVNSVTEFLPELAYNTAKELDEYLEKNGKPKGPFHGLPISVKELVGFGGHTLTRAITAYVDTIAENDAYILTILKQAGANFHVRTTEPQTYMCLESVNHLYGTTTNPHNTGLTSGGSSGGEGACLAIHASSVGIGTDIGGSIRWPASITGQYGFKPTSGRLPQAGCQPLMEGPNSIPAAIGPMTRDLASNILFTKTIIESEPWHEDHDLNAIRWNDEPLKGKTKVRIGVMTDDGMVTPQPPIQRAIQHVTEKLSAAGKIDGYEIEIVPFKPYEHERAWKIIMGLYFEDGGEFIREKVGSTGEPMLPLPDWILSRPEVKKLSIHELWARNVERNKYRKEYLAYWNQMGIDALICPVSAQPASPHGSSKYWPYCSHWNLLDYPGLVFPVTAVDPAIDKVNESYQPKNEDDKFIHELFDPEVYRDAPVGLQLVGKRCDDEKVLAIAQLIDQVL